MSAALKLVNLSAPLPIVTVTLRNGHGEPIARASQWAPGDTRRCPLCPVCTANHEHGICIVALPALTR